MVFAGNLTYDMQNRDATAENRDVQHYALLHVGFNMRKLVVENKISDIQFLLNFKYNSILVRP